MSTARLQRIQDLYESARAQPAAERAAFLAEACAGDADAALGNEVRSLLAHADSAGGFLGFPLVERPAPLQPGRTIGHYTIDELIGAGGMGEVYRARDTQLKRDVALKVLPAALATDADRLARFQREAEVLASLNHPHIAHIHGLAESDGVRALVMELVTGSTLAEMIAAPIPLAEVLPIACQIAEALEYAHERGVIHRDLKPANVIVTPEGVVKVLDFGLAKALAPDGTNPPAEAANSPTITTPAMTAAGIVLGTAAYMSPEQARGKPADKRADIWAFGVVLFEMLAGRRPFRADEAQDTLAHVLTQAPDWSALPADTPPRIRELLRRCLTKDAKQRLHDIGDARLEIEDTTAQLESDPAGSGTATVAQPRSGWTRRRVLGLAIGVCLLGGLAAGIAVWRALSAAPAIAYMTLPVAPAEELNAGGKNAIVFPAGGARTALAWSPDGRTLAFIGRQGGVQKIYLGSLYVDQARPLDGTEDAGSLAFSPEGQWIAFWANRAISKVAVAGGPPVKICDAPEPASGMTWGTTRIIFTGARRLLEVSPAGQEPAHALTDPQPELARHTSPHLLPGDTAVLYTEHNGLISSGDERVLVRRLSDGWTQRLLDGADARYLPTGHLAFLKRGTLYVVPFDRKTLTLRGDNVPVVKNISQALDSWDSVDLTLAGQFAVSAQGTLAHVFSPFASSPGPDRALVSVDRAGRANEVWPFASGFRSTLALEPTGSRIAVVKDRSLFVYPFTRPTFQRVRDAVADEILWPVWSGDGRLAIWVQRDGLTHLEVIQVDAPGMPTAVVPNSGDFAPSSWSHDGRRLVGTRPADSDNGDLWVYSPDGQDSRWASLQSRKGVSRSSPAWSPDDHSLAFVSNANGAKDVWVQPYPGPGPEVQVSTNGGICPIWNPSKSAAELFYLERQPGKEPNYQVMGVDMRNPGRPGTPRALFPFSHLTFTFVGTPTPNYAFDPNSQRFYVMRLQYHPSSPVTHIRLIQNWFEEVKVRAPPKR